MTKPVEKGKRKLTVYVTNNLKPVLQKFFYDKLKDKNLNLAKNILYQIRWIIINIRVRNFHNVFNFIIETFLA